MTEGLNLRQDINKKDRLLLIFLLFLPCLLMIRSFNDDIWFLLNSGRYVLENGIPFIEPFTIHKGFEFVMQQWLSACIFWLTYSKLGFAGLKILIMLCYALTIYFLFRLSMKLSNDYFFVSVIVTLFSSAIISRYMTERPYMFTTLIFVIEFYLLESFLLSNKRKYLYPLPILSVLLINLEAAMWPMIFIISIPYLIESFHFKIGPILNKGYKKGALFLSVLIMFFAGFLNPYGIDAMTYLYRSYGHAEISYLVTEMLPPNINTLDGLITYGSIFIVFLIYLLHKKGTIKLRYVLLTLGTAYMTLSSNRSFSFFAICGIIPLADYLRNIELPVKQNEATKRTLLLRKILIGLVLIAVISGSYINIYREKENTEYSLLSDTIHHLQNKKQAEQVKLYTGFNDGGMAEFLGIPSYIDPRAEVFVKKNNKKSDVMIEYAQLQSGRIYYKDFLNKYQFTHLILTKDDILYTLLKHDKDYHILFSNEEYTLFERNDDETNSSV